MSNQHESLLKGRRTIWGSMVSLDILQDDNRLESRSANYVMKTIRGGMLVSTTFCGVKDSVFAVILMTNIILKIM
jgi:hypothetical protein